MNEVRNVGPRGLGSDVRGELVRAGCALFEERGFGGFSLREVADRAGVNQAMVRYYFTDKLGFESALLDEGIEQYLAALPAGGDLKTFIEAAIESLNAMPWLPVLMMRTVYTSTDLRTRFVEQHTPRIIAALRGVYTPSPGQSPSYVVLSFISLLVFPHLARPVVGPVLGIGFDEYFAAGFAEHLANMFRERS